MTCCIIDDQQHVIELITMYIERTEGLTLIAAEQDSATALRRLQAGDIKPDFVLLDIDMPGLTGIELAGMIKDITGIIFMTAHRQYAPEAFELSAIDYILKPVSYPRFLESVAKAHRQLEHAQKPSSDLPYLFIPESDRNLIKIDKASIIYIEGSRNYVRIHQVNKKQLSRISMQQMEMRLKPPDFFRIHRSYIINTSQIKEISADTVIMSNGLELPVSTTYKQAFQKWAMQWRS